MLAYLYIVGSSENPDYIECPVPFYVDESEVFFGPCKKDLRRRLRKRLLARDRDDATPGEDLYLVGFNAAKDRQERKIVWAGRIKRVMTFARAWDELTGPRYEALRRSSDEGPLHVAPIRRDDGLHVGYRRVTQLHADRKRVDDPPRWIADLIGRASGRYRAVSETEIHVEDNLDPWDVFERDACFLLDNIFWAHGSGIEVKEELVEMLREAQPDRRQDIDSYAIFGLRRDGSADGRTGKWLEVKGDLARRLIAAIEKQARELEPVQAPLGRVEIQARCNRGCSKPREVDQPPQPPSSPPRRNKIC
jgi:hypothetical protein